MPSAQRAKARPVVVGVADHNGWAVLVSTAAIDGIPAVIDRRRVPLVESGVPSQPFHHETLAMPEGEAEALLLRVRRSIRARTEEAFDHLAADLGSAHSVRAITIRQPPLERLPATVKEAHASYYVTCRADGMLYHSALVAAAERRGWQVVQHARGEEVARAAAALRTPAGAVERFITHQKTQLGSPWTAEHRHAFASAVAVLKEHSTLAALDGR
jgi:hypothetical protein